MRRQLVQRNEELKRSKRKKKLPCERRLIEQERQRLEEVPAGAESRRKELEALQAELAKQQGRLSAARGKKRAELERQHLETVKAEELERLRLSNECQLGKYHALIIAITSTGICRS
jgi:hypothetical protein